MITGFRWHLQGAQTYFNIQPDLSTFGKALGNGKPKGFATRSRMNAGIACRDEVCLFRGIDDSRKKMSALVLANSALDRSMVPAQVRTVLQSPFSFILSVSLTT